MDEQDYLEQDLRIEKRKAKNKFLTIILLLIVTVMVFYIKYPFIFG